MESIEFHWMISVADVLGVEEKSGDVLSSFFYSTSSSFLLFHGVRAMLPLSLLLAVLFHRKANSSHLVEPLRPLGEGRAAFFWRKAPGCLGVVQWTGSWAGRWQSLEPQDTSPDALTSPWVHVKPLPKSLPNSPCRASHLWQWSWVPVGINCSASVVVRCNQSLCSEQRYNQKVETVGLGHFRTRREILSLLGDDFKHHFSRKEDNAFWNILGKKKKKGFLWKRKNSRHNRPFVQKASSARRWQGNKSPRGIVLEISHLG